MENVIVVLDLVVKIVQFVLAHQIAMVTVNVLITLANANQDGQDLIVHSKLVHQNAQEMDIVIMRLAFVNQDLQVFIVHFLLVHHLVQEMENVSLLELKWPVNALKDTKDMIVQKKLV